MNTHLLEEICLSVYLFICIPAAFSNGHKGFLVYSWKSVNLSILYNYKNTSSLSIYIPAALSNGHKGFLVYSWKSGLVKCSNCHLNILYTLNIKNDIEGHPHF